MLGAHAFELPDLLLETKDVSPEAIAFVGELSDDLAEVEVVGDRSGVRSPGRRTGRRAPTRCRARCARIRSAFDAHLRGLPTPRCPVIVFEGCGAHVTADYPSRLSRRGEGPVGSIWWRKLDGADTPAG